MNNLEIYDRVRDVPKEAQKTIAGGKLKGKTDINPMWRIKTLTDVFGVCGFGWKYEIVEKRLDSGAAGEIAAFVDIDLYVKQNGEWSAPIRGTGGSMFVNTERGGLVTNDECFKMALTDAISVACKAFGIGANVYWDRDITKYDKETDQYYCESCKKEIEGFKTPSGREYSAKEMAGRAYNKFGMILCSECIDKMTKAKTTIMNEIKTDQAEENADMPNSETKESNLLLFIQAAESVCANKPINENRSFVCPVCGGNAMVLYDGERIHAKCNKCSMVIA